MKKNLTKFLFLFSMVLVSYGMNAQCIATTSFGAGTLGDCPGAINITTCNFTGEYATANGVQAGFDYTFDHPDDPTFMTLTDASNTVITSGVPPLTITAAATGSVRIHCHFDATCSTTGLGCVRTTAECLNCMPTGAPANDECAGAEELTFDMMGIATVTGSTVDACPDAVDFCGTTLTTAPGVWYSFVAGGTGMVTINTCNNTNYDSKLGVFSGDCMNLVCEGGNDDACGLQSQVILDAVEGTEYFVFVTGFGTATGDFELLVQAEICIVADPVTVTFDPAEVTVCPNEPIELGDGSAAPFLIEGGVPFAPISASVIAHNSFTDNIITADIATGDELTVVGNVPAMAFIAAGEFIVDGVTGLFYYEDGDDMYVANTSGGSMLIGALPADMTGFSYDEVNDVMYGVNVAGDLYTIDLETAAATLIGNTGMGLPIWIVVDDATGNAYSADLVDDQLYSVDLATGAATAIGPVGFNMNFGQDAAFYEGQIYSYAFNATAFSCQYGTFDLATGAFTLIQDVGFTQYGAMAINPAELAGGFQIESDNMNGLEVDEDGNYTITAVPGTEIYNITVTDACGEATGTLTVNAVYDVSSLACNDHINFSVDDVCGGEITSDMILEGPLACSEVAYFVVIKDASGTEIANPPAGGWGDYVNTELTAEIVDPLGVVGCWGTVLIEDSIEPVVTGCDETPQPIQCYDVERYLTSPTLGRPNASNVIDNCSATLDWQLGAVTSVPTGQTGCEVIIYRPWSATYAKKDGTTGTLTCVKVYESQPFDVANLTLPAPLVTLDCGASVEPDDLPNGSRYPKVGGQDLKPGESICNLYASYEDLELAACAPGCNGNKKVIRTWTILDWCSGTTLPTYVQIIKATDNVGPTFITKDTVVSTRPWDCTATFIAPVPWELHDNCDYAPTYSVAGPAGVSIIQDNDGNWVVSGAPKGTHTFLYTATDCCGNSTTVPATITVEDRVGPVVSTIQDVVVALVPQGAQGAGADGQAKLFWYHVDNNSYDACTDVKVEIRRSDDAPDCGNVGVGNYNNNTTFNNDGHSADDNKDTDGGEFVKFCCEDITAAATVDANGDGVIDALDEGYVEVIVRVWDDADMDGFYGSAGDNYNEAWSFVKVEDNTPPVIQGPDNAEIYCDWAIYENQQGTVQSRSGVAAKSGWIGVEGIDFTKVGQATAYSTCNTEVVEFIDVIIINEFDGLNQCGVGVFTRVWRVTKATKNGPIVSYVFQKITVSPRPSTFVVTQDRNNNGFLDQNEIGPIGVSCSGPTDAQLENDLNSGGYAPIVSNGTCDVIGRNIKVDTFFFENGVCKKWVAKYNYVNWCDDAEQGPFEVTFMYFDEEKPVLTCTDTMYAVDAACGYDLVLENSATDNGGCVDGGWLKWQVFVDLWGDGTIDAVKSDFAFSTSWQRIPANSGLLPGGLTYNPDGVFVMRGNATTSGGTKTVSLPSALRIEGSMSNHKVSWKVTDGCHNHTTCHQEIMVVDKKAPTPYCVSLSTAVMDSEPVTVGGVEYTGMVELWATDFNVGSFDNCTAQENLLYTFDGINPVLDRIGQEHYFDAEGLSNENEYLAGLSQRWMPSLGSSAMVFTCEDVANSPVPVRMSVWDEKLNTDFCEVALTIIDNVGACGDDEGRAAVAGSMATATGVAVSGVETTLDALLPEYPRTQMTTESGEYMFMNNLLDNAYTVSATKEGGLLEGVNTLDLVKIQRHILEQELLGDAYKVIAADINNNGQIQASDLLALRKAILGVSTEFPNNASWRFVDGTQTFADVATAAADVDETREVMLTADAMGEDFVAVKVGDVNGDIDGLLQGNGLSTRSANAITLVADDKSVDAGETVSVTFTSRELADVYGYQFTMDLNGLQFAGVEAGALAMTDDNVGVLDGKVTVSYNDVVGMEAGQAEGLFTMNFVATEAGQLSNMLASTSSVTRAEAYVGESLETVGVEIAMRGEQGSEVAEYALLQNEPNPFKATTTIGFTLPSATQAQLTVLDVTGKVVLSKSIAGVAGYNQVTLGKEDIRVSGVLYYTLESGDFTATKKMIIIE